jgi:integrase
MSQRDGVYKRKDRPGLWISWKDVQGRRRYRKTDANTLAQARSARSAELVRVEQAKVLGFMPPGEDAFAEAATRFLAYQNVRLTPKAYDREEGIVRRLLVPFFSGKLATVRKTDVQRYVTKRCGEVAPATVRKELNVIKHMLNWAVEEEIIPANPATQGKKLNAPKPPAGRVRYLQPTEVRAILEDCPSWLEPIVAIAVSTGMRRSEILGLRWLDVDLVNRCIMPQSKNGDGRIVHLNQLAQAVIRSLPFGTDTRPTDMLFPGINPDWLYQSFRKVCENLSIEDFSFHDLRHTAASWLRMKGADIHTVAQLLGHKDLRMAARYQHLSPAFLAEAVGRLDGVFGNLCYQDVTKPKGEIAESSLSALK